MIPAGANTRRQILLLDDMALPRYCRIFSLVVNNMPAIVNASATFTVHLFKIGEPGYGWVPSSTPPDHALACADGALRDLLFRVIR